MQLPAEFPHTRRDQYIVALPHDLLSDPELYLALLVVRNHRLWLDIQTLELINALLDRGWLMGTILDRVTGRAPAAFRLPEMH